MRHRCNLEYSVLICFMKSLFSIANGLWLTSVFVGKKHMCFSALGAFTRIMPVLLLKKIINSLLKNVNKMLILDVMFLLWPSGQCALNEDTQSYGPFYSFTTDSEDENNQFLMKKKKKYISVLFCSNKSIVYSILHT